MSDPFSSPDNHLDAAHEQHHDESPPLSRDSIFQDNLNPLQRSMVWPPVNPNQPPVWLRTINSATETCVFKAGISAFAGGGLGVLFGLFFGGYANAVDKAVETEGPASLKLRVGFKEAARAMRSYSKNFALFGASFSAAECTVEKLRARHDIWNSIIGGCAAGAFMSSAPTERLPPRARAMQMAFGCASVGAFSAAIDYYMEYMD
ncbi:mitochondrial inner membrane insertion complex subunit Tim22 [Gracilaria domingensis]|nr:mitochondrial inner membrane insertion complex subunit Tim22 [Gracilaria domingensis]